MTPSFPRTGVSGHAGAIHRFPDLDHRLSVGHDGLRAYGDDPNTDETVYDPRVWDKTAKNRWLALLRDVRPRVVLISSVSPAHRYALQIATMAKEAVPGVFVVLGLHGVWQDTAYPLGESITCPAS